MIATVGSVCSGIEAASVAWEPLGMQFKWYSEISAFPSRVLLAKYPSTPNLGDMNGIPDAILSREVVAPDLVCGGTPCQAFFGGSKMRFSQFCDQVENTEQEQQLLQFFQQDDMKETESVFSRMSRIPIIGKLFAAVVALGSYESIADFRQSEHYRNIKDWNFTIDFDKKNLFIRPNEEQRKKAIKTLALTGAAITLIMVYWKLCCCKDEAS